VNNHHAHDRAVWRQRRQTANTVQASLRRLYSPASRAFDTTLHKEGSLQRKHLLGLRFAALAALLLPTAGHDASSFQNIIEVASKALWFRMKFCNTDGIDACAVGGSGMVAVQLEKPYKS
jgi:hypothetical protein